MSSASMLSSPEWLTLEEALFHFPIFPVMWTSHCIMMSLALRATFGAVRWKSFSRQHPLSCYMLAVLYTFPGGIISSLLMAEPPLAFLLNTPFMISMTLSWYSVFYFPFDLFAKLIDLLYLRLLLGIFQDVFRIHLVSAGVQAIQASNPGSMLYPIAFAVCKSSGFMFIKYAENILLSGGLQRAFIIPHHSTKSCLLAAIFYACAGAGYIELTDKAIFTIFALVMIASRVLTLVTDADPYSGFESISCYFLFGANEAVGDEKTVKNGKKKAD